MKRSRKRKAQSIMEYAILFGIVIGAFSVMQLYLRRSMNAQIKDGADNLADIVMNQAGGNATKVFNKTNTQYEPYYMTKGSSQMQTTRGSGTEEGVVSTDSGKRVLTGQTSSTTGTRRMVGWNQSD